MQDRSNECSRVELTASLLRNQSSSCEKIISARCSIAMRKEERLGTQNRLKTNAHVLPSDHGVASYAEDVLARVQPYRKGIR